MSHYYWPPTDVGKITQITQAGIHADLVVPYATGTMHFHQSLVGYYAPKLLTFWTQEVKLREHVFTMEIAHALIYGGIVSHIPTDDEEWDAYQFAIQHDYKVMINSLRNSIISGIKSGKKNLEICIVKATLRGADTMLAELVGIKIAKLKTVESAEQKAECKHCCVHGPILDSAALGCNAKICCTHDDLMHEKHYKRKRSMAEAISMLPTKALAEYIYQNL